MSQTRARVLVIDDEPDMREMLAFDLSQEGFEVTVADGGAAAIAAVQQTKFDLALTDLKMPGMSGVETVAALKSLDPDIEVIVATGYATVETAIACMKHGAYDYIQKPYDLAKLRRLLERAIEKSQLQGVVALYEASSALLATLKHADLVHLVLDLAERVMRTHAVGLALRRQNSGGLEFSRPAGARLPSDAQLALLMQRAVDAGGPLRLMSPIPAEFWGEQTEEPFTSALVYPLGVRNQSLGALVLLRDARLPAFTAAEIQRGNVFATQIALALDDARLYGELALKVDELLATRDQLLQAEKIALAGRLAGGVAHEVNNPLTFLRANLSMLRDYSSVVGSLWLAAKDAAEYLQGQSDPAGAALGRRIVEVSGGNIQDVDVMVRDITATVNESLDGVRRIADLVAGFTRLAAQPKSPSPERVDVTEVLNECVAIVTASDEFEPRDIVRETADVPSGLAARTDLRAALLNVLLFLRTAERGRPRGDVPPIRVRVQTVDGRPCIKISDPTLVLSAEERVRVFDPRLEVDSRSGVMRLDLGLALACQTLRQNHGEITAEGDVARGTTFQILLAAG